MTHAIKTYGRDEAKVRALDDVTVAVPSSQFTAVMGPSGSGKSTLLHCMGGLDTLDEGIVHIGDVALDSLRDRELTILRRERVGFVFQSFNLLPTLNALENITVPLRLAGVQPEDAWLDQVVDTLGLRDRLGHRPSELSGGQQQRVALARALITKPVIIFADEPTGNLDSRSAGEVLRFLARAAREFGQTVVMVTHDPVAASYADRAWFLNDGRVVGEMPNPTPDAVLDALKTLGALEEERA
jgi:putative ABC transport system ATP-binding protein